MLQSGATSGTRSRDGTPHGSMRRKLNKDLNRGKNRPALGAQMPANAHIRVATSRTRQLTDVGIRAPIGWFTESFHDSMIAHRDHEPGSAGIRAGETSSPRRTRRQDAGAPM